ncbi:TlpA family protein disulfide reductase [Mucilaginibacter sp. HC2]|uniref:TlpA family protein disulfide reductase n=1 Tax=Mucilaginibacter inviolabilis TaxID=2714892 RepID=UPI001409F8E4|nr:TlpA disulfide reductase family protein [Mucilaginibacter inviolabilis]NHA05204.1 TlpA family protein disulfide reductase [Mucilaginibacter inviolabilis]
MKSLSYILLMSMLLWASGGRAQNKKLKKDQHQYLPDIDVYDINGKHTTLRQLGKNKVLFIDSWFIPCPPCFREMNVLHQLYAKYKTNKNFNFITICRTDSAIARKFFAQDKSMARYINMYHGFSHLKYFKLPVYFIPGCNEKIYVDRELTKYTPDDKAKCPDAQFGFHGYPTIVIFDKKGKLLFKKTGYDDDAEEAENTKIEQMIKEALAIK